MCQDQPFPTTLRITLHDNVIKLRIESHPLVPRQGPGCRRPDHHENLSFAPVFMFSRHSAEQVTFIGYGKTHIDCRRLFIQILHLCFRQCGAAIQTPVYRLKTPHKVLRFNHLAQRTHNVRFGLVIHGQVRRIPISQHSQPLKIGLLSGYLFLRVFAASIAKRARIHPYAYLADLLLHLVFNGQPMAVPAGHIRAIQPIEAVRLDDNVFQDFIDGMPEMDVAVGIGWTVMQDILPSAFPAPADA